MHDSQNKNLIFDRCINDPEWKSLHQKAPDISSNAAPRNRTSLNLPETGLDRVNKSEAHSSALFLVINRCLVELLQRLRMKNHERLFSCSLIRRNASSAGIPFTFPSRKSCSRRSNSAMIALSTNRSCSSSIVSKRLSASTTRSSGGKRSASSVSSFRPCGMLFFITPRRVAQESC